MTKIVDRVSIFEKYYNRKKTSLSNIKQGHSMAWYELNKRKESRINLLVSFHVGKQEIYHFISFYTEKRQI